MELVFKIFKSKLYVKLIGELDECVASKVRMDLDKLIDDNRDVEKFIIDMSSLNFMDSTGIGVLLGRYKKLKNLNIPLYIQSPSIAVDKILRLSGIYDIVLRV